MRTKLSVAIALAGTLLATCLVSGSAKATSVPVLKVEGSSGIVTLVGRGGRGGGGRHYGGGGRHYGGGAVRRNYGGGGGGVTMDIATMAIVTTVTAIVIMAIAVIEAVAGMADAGGAMA